MPNGLYNLFLKVKSRLFPQRNVYYPPLDEREKKMVLVRTLLEFDVVMHFVVGGIFLFLIILVVAWKFNFIDYFKSNQSNTAQKSMATSVSFTPKTENQVLLGSSSVYINKQEVSIEKAFNYKPPKLKLTVNGQLKKEVFGYLPYWVLPQIDDINTNLLTDISYFGLTVSGDGSVVINQPDGTLDPGWKAWNDPKLADFIKKSKKQKIKFFVTLKCFNQDDIQKLVLSPDASSNFINSAIYLMSSRNLDGINLDFEYVGQPSKDVIDGYSILVANLNKEMKRQYPQSTLTVSTFATAASTMTLDDVAILSHNSDALIVMGYDFSTPDSTLAGAVAPMDGLGYSLTSAISSYLEKVDPDKVILAVPYYGYDWPVSSNSMNAQVVGPSTDVLVHPYAEIMQMTQGKQVNWDDSTLTPWFTYNDSKTGQLRVVHYEDTRSLGIKYDFINQKNLKGVGIWALGFDGTSQELTQLLADKFAN